MGIFDRFIRRKGQEISPSANNEVQVNYDDSGEKKNIIRHTVEQYDLSTGLPIDSVYAFMNTNWESEGQTDAFNNSDVIHMEEKIKFITNRLHRYISIAELKYDDLIHKATANIDTLSKLGMTMSVSEQESEIKRYKEHKEKLEEIKEGNSEEVLINTYRCGFMIGVKKLINDKKNE